MKKWIAFLCFSICLVVYGLPVRKGEHFRVPVSGQFIVEASADKIDHRILKRIAKNLYLIESHNQKSLKYDKVYPNYRYFGDYKDVQSFVPNDRFLEKQYHHNQINTFEAWSVTQGDDEIVVAITDNEFQLDHKDLIKSWWINPEEIPENGLDDDGNGYVDDVRGWDFVQDDNDVDANNQPTHGTHLAGIIAAHADNSFGGAGIAPKVKVMPLRWYGEESQWTTAIIAETYHYAIDNGAKVISTSYNIDHLVDDQLYRDLLVMAKEAGILVFNSAGNGNKKDPTRHLIDEVILVCSVTSSFRSYDKKSRFSNYGRGVDICAPGDPIFSTVQINYGTDDRSANLRGTSMATPVAAAIAGLIWSAYPHFSAEEVREKLYKTADNIDDKNKSYRGLLGHGRVNAYQAVR